MIRAELIGQCTRSRIGDAIYVIHAFQKKSKARIATLKPEMDLVRRRLRELRSELRNAKQTSS